MLRRPVDRRWSPGVTCPAGRTAGGGTREQSLTFNSLPTFHRGNSSTISSSWRPTRCHDAAAPRPSYDGRRRRRRLPVSWGTRRLFPGRGKPDTIPSLPRIRFLEALLCRSTAIGTRVLERRREEEGAGEGGGGGGQRPDVDGQSVNIRDRASGDKARQERQLGPEEPLYEEILEVKTRQYLDSLRQERELAEEEEEGRKAGGKGDGVVVGDRSDDPGQSVRSPPKSNVIYGMIETKQMAKFVPCTSPIIFRQNS